MPAFKCSSVYRAGLSLVFLFSSNEGAHGADRQIGTSCADSSLQGPFYRFIERLKEEFVPVGSLLMLGVSHCSQMLKSVYVYKCTGSYKKQVTFEIHFNIILKIISRIRSWFFNVSKPNVSCIALWPWGRPEIRSTFQRALEDFSPWGDNFLGKAASYSRRTTRKFAWKSKN
jgi:hypothetical protein